MFNALLNTLAPVFICIAIGYGWQRFGFEYQQQFVSRLVMSFGAPCLIVAAISNTTVSLDQFAGIAAAAVIVAVLCALLALPFARRTQADPMAIVAPIAIPNTGNMGLSICLFAFGEPGLALAIAYFVTSTLINMTVAIPLFARNGSGYKGVASSLARQPLVYATFFSIALLVFDIRLPVWLANTTSLLGDITIPLMLVTLGVSLGSIKHNAWLLSSGYAVLRLTGGFVFALLATKLLGITGLAQKIVILQSVMPAAVFNYLFALHYGRSPDMAAGIVVSSTLIGVLLLPVILSFLLA